MSEDVEGSVVWAATWGATLVFEGCTATGACQSGRPAQSSRVMVASWPILLLRTMSGSCHRVVCVNVPGNVATRSHKYLGSGTQLLTRLVSTGNAATGVMPVQVACTATSNNGAIRVQVAA